MMPLQLCTWNGKHFLCSDIISCGMDRESRHISNSQFCGQLFCRFKQVLFSKSLMQANSGYGEHARHISHTAISPKRSHFEQFAFLSLNHWNASNVEKFNFSGHSWHKMSWKRSDKRHHFKLLAVRSRLETCHAENNARFFPLVNFALASITW